MNKQIAVIGLGKMGKNLAINLKQKGWDVIVYNRTTAVAQEMEKSGFDYAVDYQSLVSKLAKPRIVWLMLPAGEATELALFGENGIAQLLEPGDFIIDGANSFYKDSVKHYKQLTEMNINFLDVGVSGGPAGALNGACLMIGGKQQDFDYLEPLFKDLAQNSDAYQFFVGGGAGHFAKMVHNGIEYGMMQAIAEGFEVLKTSEFNYDLEKVAEIYNNGSVITSRLTDWLLKGFKAYGNSLEAISGSVAQSGEGEWTVNTAHELAVPVEIIEKSVEFRKLSQANPSFTGKVLTTLRNQFGGHAITK